MQIERMTIFRIITTKNGFLTHFRYVEYSTFAAARPPITTPEVGVMKLISPQAAQNIIIMMLGLKPSVLAKGPITGIDSAASPDVDGTKKLNSIYTRYESGTNTNVGTPLNIWLALSRIKKSKCVEFITTVIPRATAIINATDSKSAAPAINVST